MADGKNFKYAFVDKDKFDHIIDEGSTGYLALRKVLWNHDESEIDEYRDKVKLDLRKYRVTNEGDELMLKGCSFDESAADELTNVLVKEGYGDTKEIISSLKERKDFEKVVSTVFSDDDTVTTEDGEIYDPRKFLLDDNIEEVE